MRFMFVFCELSMGGVETLIVRMARHLAQAGHDVFAVLLTRHADQGLLLELQRFAEIIYPTKNIYHWAPFNLISEPPKNVDFIHCFNSFSLFAGAIIRNDYYPDTPIVTGVYFPREYYFPGTNARINKKISEDLFRKLPSSNIFFMNQESALAHRPCTEFSSDEELIIPLPVDTEKYASVPRTPSRMRIVSIGRLADFKTYTFHTIDAISEILSQGYDVEYHIYGDGKDREKLEQYICSKKLEAHVYCHGTIPYEQLPEALRSAFVFIGMGTSLIEASACGVPSLIAIESNLSPTSYGLFSESADYNCGEVSSNKKEVDLVTSLLSILNTTEEEYSELCVAAKKKAQEYSIEKIMDLYIRHISEAQVVKLRITNSMRVLSFFDWWVWRVLKAVGVQDPFSNRYASPATRTIGLSANKTCK